MCGNSLCGITRPLWPLQISHPFGHLHALCLMAAPCSAREWKRCGLMSTERKVEMDDYVVSDSGVKVWKEPEASSPASAHGHDASVIP